LIRGVDPRLEVDHDEQIDEHDRIARPTPSPMNELCIVCTWPRIVT